MVDETVFSHRCLQPAAGPGTQTERYRFNFPYMENEKTVRRDGDKKDPCGNTMATGQNQELYEYAYTYMSRGASRRYQFGDRHHGTGQDSSNSDSKWTADHYKYPLSIGLYNIPGHGGRGHMFHHHSRLYVTNRY